jgi:hypothetical protein
MGISALLRLNGTTSLGNLATTGIVEIKWTGSAWIRTGRWLGSSVGNVVGGGVASHVEATAIGGGTASAAGAVTVGGGAASGVNSAAFLGGTATGNSALAFKGIASGNGSVALAGAAAYLPNSIGGGINNYNGASQKPQQLEAVFARQVFEDDTVALTADGIAPGTINMLRAANFNGRMHVSAKGSLFDNTNGNRSVVFERVYDLSSNGTTLTINGFVEVYWNVIGSFSVDGPPVLSHAVGSNQDFQLIVAAPSAYALDAAATFSILGIY